MKNAKDSLAQAYVLVNFDVLDDYLHAPQILPRPNWSVDGYRHHPIRYQLEVHQADDQRLILWLNLYYRALVLVNYLNFQQNFALQLFRATDYYQAGFEFPAQAPNLKVAKVESPAAIEESTKGCSQPSIQQIISYAFLNIIKQKTCL